MLSLSLSFSPSLPLYLFLSPPLIHKKRPNGPGLHPGCRPPEEEENETSDKEVVFKTRANSEKGAELKRVFNSTSIPLRCCTGTVAGLAAGSWIMSRTTGFLQRYCVTAVRELRRLILRLASWL